MDNIKANELFKGQNGNKEFKNTYKNKVNQLLLSVDFSETPIYRIDKSEENGCTGVYDFINGKWMWSWMNAINTNYSCFELMVNKVNELIKRGLTNRNDILTFENQNTHIKDLDWLFDYLTGFKEDFFTPRHSKKNSLFNQMRFKSQSTWYEGKLAEIYFLGNIGLYFDNVMQYDLSFKRGESDDMFLGKDFKIRTVNDEFSFQHKKDTLKYFDGDYYCFEKTIYDDKNYSTVDFISITCRTYKIYLFKNSSDPKLCGMSNYYGKDFFTIHKSLLIEPKMETKIILVDTMESLLKFCFEHHINFFMDNDENSENSITLQTEPEYSVNIIFNNLEDVNFPQKVFKFYEDLQQLFN
jgi:hypothetical protein